MYLPFSDSVNKTGIVEDIDFICGTDSTSYPTADKARNINRHYYNVVQDILRSSGRWQYDDSNLASLPKVDLNMVSGTHEVALPDANLKIHMVEVKDLNGIYHKLQEIDMSEKVSMSSFTSSSGFPNYYDPIGAYLYLDPAPLTGIVTLTAGLRVWVAREIDAFTAADTTQEPGFAEPYHRILSLGGSYDYLLINGSTEKVDRVKTEYETMREALRTFYAERNRDSSSGFHPRHRAESYA